MEMKSWGKSVSIDLHGCAHERLTSADLLKQFVNEIIAIMDMEAHGPTYIDRFGDGELEGYSAMQFIKTSTITVHLDEVGNRAFLDLFSCKDFDADKAAEFAKKFFAATTVTTTTINRR